jgi:hypothetical protein
MSHPIDDLLLGGAPAVLRAHCVPALNALRALASFEK